MTSAHPAGSRILSWFRSYHFEENFRFERRHLRGDFVGGLVSAIGALPLALAFGVTSFGGAPEGAIAGLYGAIICGILASLFGGTPQQITGATGGMTVILATVFAAKGGAGAVFLVCLFAGLIEIAFGLVKIGRFVEYMPYPVVVGFTNGIAILIFLEQIDAAATAPLAAGVTIAVISLVPLFSRRIPKTMIGLVAGTAAALLFSPASPRIGPMPAGFPFPSLPQVPFSEWDGLLAPAFAIALLGAIETLLTSVVVSGASDTAHHPDKELIGQGIASSVSSLFGGITGTGGLVRSMVNVRSGGKSRLSGIVHGLILALVLLLLTKPLGLVPLGALAGVLLATSLRMFDFATILRIPDTPALEWVVMIALMIVTVTTNLVIAVEVGIILGAFLFVRRISKLEVSAREILEPADESWQGPDQTTVRSRIGDRIALYRLEGPLFFGPAKRFVAALRESSDVEIVIIDLSRVPVIDATGAERLTDIATKLDDQGRQMLVVGARREVRRVLLQLGALERIGIGRFHGTLSHALESAHRLLADRHPPEGLAGAVRPELVLLDLRPTSKEELFRFLVERATEVGAIREPHRAVRKILDREALESTGLAHGVAVPHARTEGVTEVTVVFARLATEIEWATLDGEPVRFVFLCLTPPDQENRYLKTLGEIAAHGRSPEEAEKLARATAPGEIVTLLSKAPDKG